MSGNVHYKQPGMGLSLKLVLPAASYSGSAKKTFFTELDHGLGKVLKAEGEQSPSRVTATPGRLIIDLC